MAQKKPLETAHTLFKRRHFSEVISLLEPNVIHYRDSFQFFYELGVSCMYVGDIGGAASYLQRARQLKMRDISLLTAQAALFMRKGETHEAVEYYLEILENDPSNKIAKNALDFLRKSGDEDSLADMTASGKIMRFYPPVSNAKERILAPVMTIIIMAVFVAGVFFAVTEGKRLLFDKPLRADLSGFVLSGNEKSGAVELGGSYRYILTEKEIMNSYNAAQKYFQEYRDNAAQVEVNRLLHSNASAAIRQKARLLMEYFNSPGFDTIKDVYPYAQVAQDPPLYLDCWVVWSGRVTNIVQSENGFSCDLLIGYDDFSKVEGIIPIRFDSSIRIDTEKPLRILGKISLSSDGKLLLQGKSIFQTAQP